MFSAAHATDCPEMGAKARVVVVDQYAPRGDGRFDRPYRNMLHDEHDNYLSQASREPLESLLLAVAAKDGDEVEITVRKTGRRPFGDRRIVLTAPHTYEREG